MNYLARLEDFVELIHTCEHHSTISILGPGGTRVSRNPQLPSVAALSIDNTRDFLDVV